MATSDPAVGGPARCLATLWLGCLLASAAYGLTLLLPAWVKAAGGGAAQAGLIYWCGALGAGVALLFGGRLAERSGAGWAAASGCGLYAVAAGILADSGGPGGGACAAGVLLGAGWALFFTTAPVTAARLPGTAPTGTRFAVIAGCNAAGMGTAPIAGQLLLERGVTYRGLFTLAALASLAAAALFSLLAATARAHATPVPGGIAARGMFGPARLLLAFRARRFLVMVLLGACVFTTMTTYQVTLAASRGIDPSVFYAVYTAGVVIPRLTITRMLARLRPATATTVLLAGMCSSLAGFCLAGHDLDIYGASSALLGVSYGLSYPLIAGAISAIGGYQALIACLLGVAALELAVSARTSRPTPTKHETDHNPGKETLRWTPLRQPTAP
jgi:MFS family permease